MAVDVLPQPVAQGREVALGDRSRRRAASTRIASHSWAAIRFRACRSGSSRSARRPSGCPAARPRRRSGTSRPRQSRMPSFHAVRQVVDPRRPSISRARARSAARCGGCRSSRRPRSGSGCAHRLTPRKSGSASTCANARRGAGRGAAAPRRRTAARGRRSSPTGGSGTRARRATRGSRERRARSSASMLRLVEAVPELVQRRVQRDREVLGLVARREAHVAVGDAGGERMGRLVEPPAVRVEADGLEDLARERALASTVEVPLKTPSSRLGPARRGPRRWARAPPRSSVNSARSCAMVIPGSKSSSSAS